MAIASNSPRRGELPPRARRILPQHTGLCRWGGTTSACAENTCKTVLGIAAARNYLRVRGEYGLPSKRSLQSVELPPRARRILTVTDSNGHQVGTTSACAENTAYHHPASHHHRNYLRVRGEYPGKEICARILEELPPRARRIPWERNMRQDSRRTTSACAENTYGGPEGGLHPGNYLRVRGEYLDTNIYRITVAELPPRARRIPCKKV